MGKSKRHLGYRIITSWDAHINTSSWTSTSQSVAFTDSKGFCPIFNIGQDASAFSDGEVELSDEWLWEKLKEWNNLGVFGGSEA